MHGSANKLRNDTAVVRSSLGMGVGFFLRRSSSHVPCSPHLVPSHCLCFQVWPMIHDSSFSVNHSEACVVMFPNFPMSDSSDSVNHSDTCFVIFPNIQMSDSSDSSGSANHSEQSVVILPNFQMSDSSDELQNESLPNMCSTTLKLMSYFSTWRPFWGSRLSRKVASLLSYYSVCMCVYIYIYIFIYIYIYAHMLIYYQ